MEERKYTVVEGPQRPEQETKPQQAEQTRQAQVIERIELKIDALLEMMGGLK